MRSKKPHWTKKVPTAPGLYWYRIADEAVGGAAYNAGKEFTFIGTDSAAGPKELRGNTEWDAAIPRGTRERAQVALSLLHGDELLGCYCTDSARCHGQVIMKLWAERHGGKK